MNRTVIFILLSFLSGQTSCGDDTSSDTALSENCDDGVRNQDESDIDCGGICGKTCLFDDGCSGDDDCEEGVCSTGDSQVCIASSDCGDGTVEEGEECDDGNNDNGDGCNSNCQTSEAAGAACDMDSRCDSELCFSQVCFNLSEQYLKAYNADAEDRYGESIALDGNTLVVGAVFEDGSATSTPENDNNDLFRTGAVYVYTRNNNTWNVQALLKASNANSEDLFGGSVAIDGDTIVVGAIGEAGDGNSTPSGAAYVFVRNGDNWSEQAILKASNAGILDRFGTAVAIDGDTIVVGAAGENGDSDSIEANTNDNAIDAGAVYVFDRNGTTWSQSQYLKASNAGESDEFGRFIDISGDRIVIGAPEEDGDSDSQVNNTNDDALNAGAAYVFEKIGTNWTQTAYLKASNADSLDVFGTSVSIDGESLAVGAWLEDGNPDSTMENPNNNLRSSGAAYVFSLMGNTWEQTAYIKAPNTQENHFLGIELSLVGNNLLVAATGDLGSGAAFLFKEDSGVWNFKRKFKAFNAEDGDNFGSFLAMTENSIAVGAILEEGDANSTMENPNNNGGNANGAVYVWSPE